MDPARRILSSLILTSQGIQVIAAQYANAKDVRQVRGHSLILLEMELQAIAGACTAILEMLNDPFRLPQYLLNDRLIGWLSNTEPKTCLATFNEMQDFLKVDQGVQRFDTTKFPYPEDEAMVAAITLFHSRKGHFQFLLTEGIW